MYVCMYVCILKRKGMNSKSFSNGGLASNTKSRGEFWSKIRQLLSRKSFIQHCFDHCVITDSSLKLKHYFSRLCRGQI